MKIISKLFSLALFVAPVAAFDYSITAAGSIELMDVGTSISGLETIFVGEATLVTASELEWEYTGHVNKTDNILKCETFVDGVLKSEGIMPLNDVGRELPTSIDCGEITIPEGGRYEISVVLTVDSSEASTSSSYEVYGAGVAILPLCVILLLAVTTHMVELSLFAGIFIGACIVAGNLNAGFTSTLDNYILMALADEGHVFVILFTLFLSGLVAMLEKSGGMFGFTKDISAYATSARSGQFACFCVGILVFFDDYANCLLAGKSLRPLLDTLFVSREKLAFIVDATAAPIASISPVSSWVGFEIGLIQEQIDRIIEQQGTEDIGIETSGFAVFLQSIKYRYYPIFTLVLMLAVIFSQRDFGAMLIAERKTQVYKRTDGGDAATERKSGSSSTDTDTESDDDMKKGGESKHHEEVGGDNEPRKDTPQASWNMLVPILLLIFFIFYLLIKSGDSGEPGQSVMDKIESSDSYVALLYGTMAATLVTLLFYLCQIVQDGKFVAPTGTALYQALTAGSHNSENSEEPRARFLMSVRDSVDSFMVGLARVFPALIVLTLAWASGSIMIAVGADRLFAKWISQGLAPESLPTVSFIISLFMALATGTSWGTMTILFPLLLVPTYNASNGDETIFYAVVAGVLSGSVAGDHMSPISDTTVLSALACDCNLLAHVGTQAPYVLLVAVISILLGTIPIGYGAWPNIIGILLGAVLVVTFVYLVCAPVISPSGKFDLFTELYLMIQPNESLDVLKEATIKAYNGQEVVQSNAEEVAGGDEEVAEKEIKKEDSAEEVEDLAAESEEVFA